MAVITGFITVADVTDGSTSGFVIIYQRALVEPAVPADTTGFIPASQTFTAPTGWSKTIPAGTNSLYVTTATYNQDTTTLEWSEVILLSGAEGDDGSRGPGRWNHRVGTSLAASYTDAQLDAFLATAVPGTNEDTPVASDQLWLYASATPSDANPTAQMVYLYNGSSWNEQEEVIDGDLLVAGTVTADNVVANVSISAPTITGGTLRASVIEGAIIKSLVDVTPVNQDLSDSLFASSAEKKRAFTRRIGSDPAELTATGTSAGAGIDTAISDISIGSLFRLLNVNQDIPASVSAYVTTPTATSRSWHTHTYHELKSLITDDEINNGDITEYVVLPDSNNSVTLKWPSVTVTIKDGNDATIATATRAAESKTLDASTLSKGSLTSATTTETTFTSGRFEHFKLYPAFEYRLSSYYRSAGDYTWANNFSIDQRPNYDSRGDSSFIAGAGFIHLQDDEYIEVSVGAIDTTFTGGSPEHRLAIDHYSIATLSDSFAYIGSSDTSPSRSDVYFNNVDQVSSGDDDPGDILSTEGDDTDNTYVIPKSAFDDSDSVSYDPITNKIIVDDVVGANITGTIDGNVTSLVNVSGGAITGDITEANLIVGEADVNITGSSTTIAGKGAFIINDGSDEPVFGIGDFDNNKYMSYDLNDGLVVRGTLNADDVIAGSLKGGTLVSSAIPTDSTKGSYLDLDNGTFVFGDSAEHLAYDGTNFTFSGIAIDAEDLNNLAALDGKIQGSGLQNYADSTAYAAGTLVISDDRLFEAINTILATNTTNPEDDSTNWKEISASSGATYTAGTGLTLTGTAFSVTNPFTDADETKLDGIETAATADQTDAEIVTAAGSDTNIKALIDFTGTPVFTDTDTDTTYTASTGITLTGTAFSVTNPFTDADETKLDGIETSATADQTDAEIVTAAGSDSNLKSLIDFTGTPVFTDTDTNTTYTASTGITLTGTAFSVTNPFTDADETKLDGIETSATADQTDAEIITAVNTNTKIKALTDFSGTPVFTDTQRTDESIRDVVGTAMTSGTDISVVVSDANDTITVNHGNTSSVNDFNDTDGNGTPDVANLGALVNRMNFDSNGHVTGYGFLSQDTDTGAVTLTVSGSNYSLDINANSITSTDIKSANATFDNLVSAYAAIDVIAASTIDTDVLNANAVQTRAIQSTNFDGTFTNDSLTTNGTVGWAIGKDGTAVFHSATIRGTLDASDISSGTLSVDRINGLEIAQTEIIGNTGVGTSTFSNITTGHSNSSFGFGSMIEATSTSACTAMGGFALRNLTTGVFNSAFGHSAGSRMVGGAHNSLLGSETGERITTGSYNTGIGARAFGDINTEMTGDANIAIGSGTAFLPLGQLTSGGYNIAIGHGTLDSLTTGLNNVAIGSNNFFSVTGGNLTTGSDNVVVGSRALADSVTSTNCVAVGYNAGTNDNVSNITQVAVSDAVFTSRDTASFLSSDRWDVRDGGNYLDTTVSYTAWTGWDGQFLAIRFPFGENATLQASLGAYVSGLSVTVTIGTAVATFAVSSVSEDIFGAYYLELGTPSSTTGAPASTGSISVDFTSFSASPTNHTDCVFIGAQSSSSQPTGGLDNASSLGYNASTQLSGNNQIAIGDTSVTSIKGQVAFGTYSDKRDKTDFEDLDLGLDFINSLNAKKFARNSRERYYEEQPKVVDGEVVFDEDGNPEMESVFNEAAHTAGLKKDTTDTIGFKAQDIQEQLDLLDKSNYDFCDNSDPEKLNVKYGDMTAILWKAVQELSTSNNELKARIEALEG